jgi:hypothetical protein
MSRAPETNRAGRQARIQDHLTDILDKAWAINLAGRQIDRTGQVGGIGILAAPLGQLPGRGLEHVRAEGREQTHVPAQAKKIGRHEQAAPRMLPARQGLKARQPAGAEMDDGLEIGHNLAALYGRAQIRF